jgi:hypothetical protein
MLADSFAKRRMDDSTNPLTHRLQPYFSDYVLSFPLESDPHTD